MNELYFEDSATLLLQTLNDFPLGSYLLANNKKYAEIIDDIQSSNDKVNGKLYKAYADNLTKAAHDVLHSDNADDEHFALQQRLILNANKFAASKAYLATQELREAVNDGDLTQSNAIINKYNRYQAAEYAAALSRSRTAKQWQQFNGDEERNKLFPNMKWLPSTSVTPRVEHQAFWNIVLPKNDSFWSKNQPGNLWGCKCDWVETDDSAAHAAPETEIPAAVGLQGNPGEEPECIFSPDASYFTKVIRNEEAEKAVQQVEYTDAQSKLRINVWADWKDTPNNVRVGRILLKNYPNMDLAIAANLKGQKNPEFLLNKAKADVKTPINWAATDAFVSANKQGCQSVVLDMKQVEGKNLKLDDFAKDIRNRFKDFTSGNIKECYIVFKGKSVLIDRYIFRDIPADTVRLSKMQIENLDNRIKDKLYKLLK